MWRIPGTDLVWVFLGQNYITLNSYKVWRPVLKKKTKMKWTVTTGRLRILQDVEWKNTNHHRAVMAEGRIPVFILRVWLAAAVWAVLRALFCRASLQESKHPGPFWLTDCPCARKGSKKSSAHHERHFYPFEYAAGHLKKKDAIWEQKKEKKKTWKRRKK